MAEFLNTEKAYATIVDIISKASNKLVLISPYIKIPERLFERLKDADRKGSVKITIVCRKKDLKHEVRSDLAQIKNLELRFLESLHAKCFYNEKSMVITSLNLHEHSQQQNREMGVLLTLKDDQDVFKEALHEAEFIVRLGEEDKSRRAKVYSAVKDELREPKGKPYSYRTKQTGYCIRCRIIIPYELEKPLCPDCFSEWDHYGNPNYEEHFCHTCGKRAVTTKSMPQCDSCYDKSRR